MPRGPDQEQSPIVVRSVQTCGPFFASCAQIGWGSSVPSHISNTLSARPFSTCQWEPFYTESLSKYLWITFFPPCLYLFLCYSIELYGLLFGYWFTEKILFRFPGIARIVDWGAYMTPLTEVSAHLPTICRFTLTWKVRKQYSPLSQVGNWAADALNYLPKVTRETCARAGNRPRIPGTKGFFHFAKTSQEPMAGSWRQRNSN